MNFRQLIERVIAGEVTTEEAERHLTGYGFAATGLHRIDVHRERRTALPEVVFGLAKSAEEIHQIAQVLLEHDLPFLATKVSAEKAIQLLDGPLAIRDAVYEERAQIIRVGRSKRPVDGDVVVITAGSSDAAIAEEAAVTLEFFGVNVRRVFDCGVAGIHRLFAAGETIREADVAIVVAGMDGALPSVVGGLFPMPLIAVPTSVGYGASFQGLAALLTMLNACAPGITVVNIDNGFGAASAAVSILKLAAK